MSDTLETLKQLDKRDWWLWWTALAVMVLLLVALAAVAMPIVVQGKSWAFSGTLIQHIRLLSFAVLLFGLYAVYQQLVIKRLRTQLVDQIEANISIEVRTKEYKNLAIIDPLTGAYNRRMVEDRLRAEVVRSERHGYPLTLIAFDLNNFKQINDTRGHAAGDAVLKYFAQRLKKATRGSDISGRIGGDEFVIILSECRSSEVERVLNRLGNLKADLHGEEITFEYSVGWAEYQTGESFDQLLERADGALYADKRARKGISTSSSAGAVAAGQA